MIVVELFVRERRLEEGFLFNSVTLFLSNAFTTPAMNYFNIWYYIRLRKRKAIMNPEKNSVFNQMESNGWFNGPLLQMEFKYVFAIKNLCLTAFYAPIMPILVPITLLGLICSYWMDKYLILRRYNEPELLSPYINKKMSRYLDYVPLCFAAGNLFFKMEVYEKLDSQAMIDATDFQSDYVILAVSLINYFVPSLTINKWLFAVDDFCTSDKPSYSKARMYFRCEYDRTNPLTKRMANKQWFKYLHI